MGYHIVNLNSGNIEHKYVENEIDIVYLDNIREETIIYKGEKHWTPIKFGNDPKYKNYTKDWFRAGIKAQELFKKQAKEEKLMLEELFQDKKSFQQYLINDEYLAIKRGDFLIRNYSNIEVDVKCKSFYEDFKGDLVFDFKCSDVERHLNMQSLTKSPVVIAVYKRDGDEVIKTQPSFFSIELMDFFTLNKKDMKPENTGFCYQVPLNKTILGFDFIKNYYVNKKSYSIEEKRKKHINAYKKWTKEEDDTLKFKFGERKTLEELSFFFGRNISSIKSRIEKLELVKKYGS
jgi:hypothetical protein